MTIEEAVATQLLPYAHTTLLTEPEKKEYIITFGYNSKYRMNYHVIHALTQDEAREEAFRVFGQWSMIYSPPDARAKSGVDFFKLTEV